MPQTYTRLYDSNLRKLKANIDAWIYKQSLKELIACFGIDSPNNFEPKDQIAWLVEMSDMWDYRRKQVKAFDSKTNEAARWLLTDDNLPEGLTALLPWLIDDLGLNVSLKPSKVEYDYVTILGGARYSCYYRTYWSKHLIDTYRLSPKEIVILSGNRLIAESERFATDTYALNAKTEFDLSVCALEKVYGPLTMIESNVREAADINQSSCIYKYQNTSGMMVSALSAPSTKLGQRANTADSYKFFAEEKRIKKGSKILMVTSPMFVNYQQLEAVRMLSIPYQLDVEVVGFENIDIFQQLPISTTQYLQEVRSIIQAIDRLYPVLIENR